MSSVDHPSHYNTGKIEVIDFRLHPMFAGDEFLKQLFNIAADHMRDKYLEPKEESDA